MKKSYYIDTCIYLNLWQKEIDDLTKTPLWKFTKEFLEKVETENSVIYYSGFILKELKFILTDEEFGKKRVLFESSPNFRRIFLSEEEFNLARKIEKESNHEVSFYDIIHMLLAKKTGSILVTRDKKLLEFSEKYSVIAKKPEQL
ncbi:MAG: type II toxin-antitoxin system VapC family toxin [Candidatus Nanoarchaeia archaeon]|nr:type II toxin-antitoxin system VapC family toxin [Candidatus Nanoarchaeia archaeon]MDD5740986.1 type II toxin-antitoxin system VapC family toxin [Candidatus Nanoarchaeia archaeon]